MKIVAIDMDGTLLTSDNRLSHLQSDYLMQLSRREDIELVNCTGRPLAGINNFLPEELYRSVYKIALNGSLIVDKKDNLIDIKTVNHKLLNDIIDFVNENNLAFTVNDTYGFYGIKGYENDYVSYDLALNKMQLSSISIENVKKIETMTKCFYLWNRKNK